MVNERERRLFTIASCGFPITNDFLEEFQDDEETLRLGLTLAIRSLLILVCKPETAPKDLIPAARLIFQLNGRSVGDDAGEEGLSKSAFEKISAELSNALERQKNSRPPTS